MHYAIRDQDANPVTTNDRQLVRCVNQSSTDATTCNGVLRVLANYVTNPTPIFNYTAAPTNVVTVTLQIQYQSPLLPAGSQSTPRLTSQVKLRN